MEGEVTVRFTEVGISPVTEARLEAIGGTGVGDLRAMTSFKSFIEILRVFLHISL